MNDIFLKNMQNILGQNYDNYLLSMKKEPIKAFRVNTKKLEELGINDTTSHNYLDKFIDFPIEQNKINKNLFLYNNSLKLGDSVLHKSGLIYIQEPSSSMAVFALSKLAPFGCKRVLDMCAAPGGKTSQLAELVGENGFVLSNEINLKRAQILRSNIERLGYTNVAISCCDTNIIAKELKHQFDAVLCDAPCSGEGMFRKDSDAIKEWSENATIQNPKKQLQILENASSCVIGGGYLIYSTCTFNLNENEQVVYDFLQNHHEYSICELDDNINKVSENGKIIADLDDLKKARRFYPFKNFGEGQFICILKNNNEPEREYIPYRPKETSKEGNQIKKLLKDLFNIESSNFTKLGNLIYLHPNNIAPIQNLPLLTCGVAICDLTEKTLKPHHNLFTAFGTKCTNKVNLNLNDERIFQYLRGEQICAQTSDGYCAILAEQLPLGYGKSKNNTINNHYPKGLRIKN